MLSSALVFSFSISLLRKLVSETVSSQDFLYSTSLAPPDPRWRVHVSWQLKGSDFAWCVEYLIKKLLCSAFQSFDWIQIRKITRRIRLPQKERNLFFVTDSHSRYKHQKVLFTDRIDLDASECFRYYRLNTLDNRTFELQTFFTKVSSSDKY